MWQTVRRITQEILGVKGLNSWSFMCFTIFYTFGLTPPVRLCGLHKNAGKLTSPTIKSELQLRVQSLEKVELSYGRQFDALPSLP